MNDTIFDALDQDPRLNDESTWGGPFTLEELQNFRDLGLPEDGNGLTEVSQ